MHRSEFPQVFDGLWHFGLVVSNDTGGIGGDAGTAFCCAQYGFVQNSA